MLAHGMTGHEANVTRDAWLVMDTARLRTTWYNGHGCNLDAEFALEDGVMEQTLTAEMLLR